MKQHNAVMKVELTLLNGDKTASRELIESIVKVVKKKTGSDKADVTYTFFEGTDTCTVQGNITVWTEKNEI